MNIENFDIYVADSVGALAIISNFKTKRKAALIARTAWIKRNRGIGSVTENEQLTGILCKPKMFPPTGWKAIAKPGMFFPPNITFVPDRRSKRGKELDEEMGSLRVPTSRTLAENLGAGWRHVKFVDGGLRMLESQCFLMGGRYILIVPRGKELAMVAARRLTRIKLSEYYAIKEKAGVEV